MNLTDEMVRQITDRMELVLATTEPAPLVRVGSKVMPTAPHAPAPDLPGHWPAHPAPIVGAPAAQGDLLFVPSRRSLPHWAQPLRRITDLVTEGNGHRMEPDGPDGSVRYAVLNGGVHGGDHVIGLLEVSPGGACLIGQPRGHDRHKPLVLGPGTWEIRRQTEQVAPGSVHYKLD